VKFINYARIKKKLTDFIKIRIKLKILGVPLWRKGSAPKGRAFRYNLFAQPASPTQQKGFPLQSLTHPTARNPHNQTT
jgi:hypothetical protein